MYVLIACEFSGVVRDAFAARGHEAFSCDLLPSEKPGNHIRGDVRTIMRYSYKWDLMIAHPPCTRLANSGVRWLHERNLWKELKEAAEFYKALRDLPIPKKAIENPIMHRYAKELILMGKRQIVQPWWFGEPALKATGLELIGLPELKPTNKLTPPQPGTAEHKEWSKVHRASPGPDRWKERSRTFEGIAAAMAEQWG